MKASEGSTPSGAQLVKAAANGTAGFAAVHAPPYFTEESLPKSAKSKLEANAVKQKDIRDLI